MKYIGLDEEMTIIMMELNQTPFSEQIFHQQSQLFCS